MYRDRRKNHLAEEGKDNVRSENKGQIADRKKDEPLRRRPLETDFTE